MGEGRARRSIRSVRTNDQLIVDLGAGDFATLTLDDGENKPTTRNRLKAAAECTGLSIMFRRTKDNTIVFSLGEKEDAS